jgi:hypothetical protein
VHARTCGSLREFGHLQVTGPREFVHGERESFIGSYRWQHSGLAVGHPLELTNGSSPRSGRRWASSGISPLAWWEFGEAV